MSLVMPFAGRMLKRGIISVAIEYTSTALAVRIANLRPPRNRQPTKNSGAFPIRIIRPMGQLV